MKPKHNQGGEMRKLSSLIIVGLLAFAGSARAQEEAPAAAPAGDAAGAPPAAAEPTTGAPPAEAAPAPAPAPAAAAGTTYVTRGLTVSAGALQITLPIVLNLSKEMVLKPVYVPLDVRFGVNDQLEVFLSHNMAGAPEIFGGGVCLGGTDRGCPKMYNNLNLGAQFSFLKDAGIELSGIAALAFQTLDPMWLNIDVGVGFKYSSGPIAIKATPVVDIPATKRSERIVKEFLSLPVQVAFQATPELALFLDTGFFTPFKELSKSYSVPVGIGGVFAVMPTLDVGAEFMARHVLTGAEGDKAFDDRAAMVFASFRTK
jgi:hypothetical protein